MRLSDEKLNKIILENKDRINQDTDWRILTKEEYNTLLLIKYRYDKFKKNQTGRTKKNLDVDDIRNMLEQGHSIRSIAKKLDVSDTTIHRRLKEPAHDAPILISFTKRT